MKQVQGQLDQGRFKMKNEKNVVIPRTELLVVENALLRMKDYHVKTWVRLSARTITFPRAFVPYN